MTYYIIVVVAVFFIGITIGVGVGAMEYDKNEERKEVKAKRKVYEINVEADKQPAFVPQGFIERSISKTVNERLRQMDEQSVTVVQITKRKENSYPPFKLIIARIPIDAPDYDTQLMRAMAQAEDRISTLETVTDQPKLSIFSDSGDYDHFC